MVVDVYQYDHISDQLRVQIVFIIENVLEWLPHESNPFRTIVDILCREYGVFYLVDSGIWRNGHRDYGAEIQKFILTENNVERILDIVELSFSIARFNLKWLNISPDHPRRQTFIELNNELNARFRENGFGYQLENNAFVRVDSTYSHAEIIKPALLLVQEQGYENVNKEFMDAFEHYRHGRKEAAINECLKAFESTMKIICDKNKWSYDTHATARKLIEVCIKNGLVPQYWTSGLNALQELLEHSIPTLRNKESAHGTGAIPRNIPDYLVTFMINMTASTMVFLVSAQKDRG